LIEDGQGAVDGREWFRGFAKTREEGIPGVTARETARMWNVTNVDKTRLSVLELLDRPAVLRAALDALHKSLKGG
jgi:hypothetical protein